MWRNVQNMEDTRGSGKAAGMVAMAWQDGKMFFGPWSIRMNLALPLSRVKEAFERLRRYVFQG